MPVVVGKKEAAVLAACPVGSDELIVETGGFHMVIGLLGVGSFGA